VPELDEEYLVVMLARASASVFLAAEIAEPVELESEVPAKQYAAMAVAVLQALALTQMAWKAAAVHLNAEQLQFAQVLQRFGV
jgi:hypothetical protein